MSSEGSGAGKVVVVAGGGLAALIGMIARNADNVAVPLAKTVGRAGAGVGDDVVRGGARFGFQPGAGVGDDVGRGVAGLGDDASRGIGHLDPNLPRVPQTPSAWTIPIAEATGDDAVTAASRSVAHTEASAADDLGQIGLKNAGGKPSLRGSHSPLANGVEAAARTIDDVAERSALRSLTIGEVVDPGLVSRSIARSHFETVTRLRIMRPHLTREAAERIVAARRIAATDAPQSELLRLLRTPAGLPNTTRGARPWIMRSPFKGLTESAVVDDALELAAKHGEDWPQHFIEEIAGHSQDIYNAIYDAVAEEEDELSLATTLPVLTTDDAAAFRKQLGAVLEDARQFRAGPLAAAADSTRRLRSGDPSPEDRAAIEQTLFDVNAQAMLYRLVLTKAARDAEQFSSAVGTPTK